MIENLILKKTNIKDGTGVSQDGNIHIRSTFPDILTSVLTGQYVRLNTTKTNTLWH